MHRTVHDKAFYTKAIFLKFFTSDQAGSNVGDNYACEMKAVEVVADVRGREDGGVYHYMAKCIPMDKDTDKLIREASAVRY